MTKNIFIASAEPYTGKSVIAFGMINMLLAKTQKVGYFKPIIAQEDPNQRDQHVEAMLNYFSLPVKYEDAFAFTRQDMLHNASSDNTGDILNTIISKYKKLEELLASNLSRSLSEQGVELEKEFNNWKGSLEQVDDVCIIGVKI